MNEKPGIRIDGAALVPIDALLGGRTRLEVRQAALHASRATIAAAVARAGTETRARLAGMGPGGVIVEARLPLPVVGLVTLSLTFLPSLDKAGRIVVSLADFSADMGLQVPLPRGRVVAALRDAAARRAREGIRAARAGTRLVVIDLPLMARERGVTLGRPVALEITRDGMTLRFRA